MSGYLELILVSFIFSFGGTMVKFGKEMCGPETISFLRFAIGIVCLAGLMLCSKKKIKLHFLTKWIILGAVFKAMHYFCENYGLAHGYSYGNIIITPATTVLVTIASVIIFHEKYTKKAFAATILCVAGVLLISWNGMSLQEFAGSSLAITLIFMVGAIGNAGFTVVQKQLLTQMDTYNAMLSMFILGAFFLFFPAACAGKQFLGFSLPGLISIVMLGIITGISFLMISDSMKTVPLYQIPIIQSITVIFAVVWGGLFWGEPLTIYLVAGTVLSLVGIVLLKN